MLILVAIWIVVLVELRTVLGFFGLEISPGTTAAIGILTIGAFVLWAALTPAEQSGKA